MKMTPKETLQNLREDYRKSVLIEEKAALDPIQQFDTWFNEAVKAEIAEPNAMMVASVDSKGKPSARVLLLKGYDENGFEFYTNYNSQKAKEYEQNPHCAIVFNWLGLERQIRIEGTVKKVSEATSENYFQKRPKGSQIGAWASPQSDVINDRQILEDNVNELAEKYADAEKLPKPPHWGGYIVKPTRIEFWQGRSSRLHDRLNYTLENGKWLRERLAP